MDTAVGSSVLVRAFRLALSVEGLKPKTISDYVRSLVKLAVVWTQAHPAVTATICGAKSPDHIIETGSTGEWVLSASDLVEIEALIGDVRLSDG